MSRPRNHLPRVRKVRRGEIVYLRAWANGHDHCLGRADDPPELIRENLERVISGIQHQPKPPRAEGLLISQLFGAYLRSASAPADERDRQAVKRAGVLLATFGLYQSPAITTAAALPPKLIEDWRDHLCIQKARCGVRGRNGKHSTRELDRVISRQYITKLMARVRLVYRWAAKESLVPIALPAMIATVKPPSTAKARIAPPRQAANPAGVKAILKVLPREKADMLRIQRATGMRPGEVCAMLSAEVHRAGVISLPGGQSIDLSAPECGGQWLYLPSKHKKAAMGRARPIALPVRVHKILKPYLAREKCFTVKRREYTKALVRASESLGLRRIVGHEVRHLVGTETAASGGIHAVMQRLGHSDPRTAARYVSVDVATLFATG